MKGQPLIPFLLIAVGGIFLMMVLSFVGLGGPGEEAEEENGEENGEEEEAVDLGADVYEQECLSCHGENMEGDTGPAIEGEEPDSVMTAIEEGPGSMPADLVSGEDAEAVAEYVSEGGGE